MQRCAHFKHMPGWQICHINILLTLTSVLKQLHQFFLLFLCNFRFWHYWMQTLFSYLLLFQTWLRATRTQLPWSPALCTPLGLRRWRSHHRTPFPTLHCRKLPPGPHNVSSSPPLDVAGLQGCQIGHCTAPKYTTRLLRDKWWKVGPAWCRPKEEEMMIYNGTK